MSEVELKTKTWLLFCFLIFCSVQSLAAPVQLALNWKPEPQFGGFYQAEMDGDFQKQGLQVQITEGGSGTPTVQMLANGKVDFAIVSAEEILTNNELNSKNQVLGVFAVFQTNPQMIMCHQEQGFQSLSDVFNSKTTLAWQAGLTYAQYLKAKYRPTQPQLVPYLGGVTNFSSDSHFCQQGFATSEPLLAEKAGQHPKVFLVADEGFNPYTTVVAVRQETWKAKPELVQKMVTAIRQGWLKYLQDPTKANLKMQSLNKAMDLTSFQKSAEVQKTLILTKQAHGETLGQMQLERWSQLLQQLHELGTIPHPLSADQQFHNL